MDVGADDSVASLPQATTSKVVERCTYPLTAASCVSRIYTDLAVLDVTGSGLRVLELAAGLDVDGLRALAGVPIDGG